MLQRVGAEFGPRVDWLRLYGSLAHLGHHGGAVSRACHAARALLYEKGLEPKPHEGVRRMIGLHYVMPGLILENAD